MIWQVRMFPSQYHSNFLVKLLIVKMHADLNRQERIDKVMSARRDNICLVLENLTEGLNISAILRTAEAFGVGQVCIIYPEDSKPKLSMNVSSGAVKWLKIEYFTSTEDCFSSLKKQGYQMVGALVDPKSQVLWDQDFTGKITLVVGNEAQGLSETAQQLMDKNIYLPMKGMTESLNVGVAAGIFLYEVLRQSEKDTSIE